MEIMIPLICIIAVVFWCWRCYTEPNRINKLIRDYTTTVLLPISNVKDSYDPHDYVEPLAVAFARFLESDSRIVSSQLSESAMGFGYIMARTVIDDEVKDALKLRKSVGPQGTGYQGCYFAISRKTPSIWLSSRRAYTQNG